MRKPDTEARADGQADLFGAPAPTRRQPARVSPRAQPPPSKPPAKPPAALLNVREAAVRLGLSKSTLDKLRCKGKGPRFIKSTERAVRYDPADLDAWIEARRRQSTAQ